MLKSEFMTQWLLNKCLQGSLLTLDEQVNNGLMAFDQVEAIQQKEKSSETTRLRNLDRKLDKELRGI